MASMTDIVFLLLIFFLVTSTLVNPNALKLLLPKSTNQVAAKPTLTVSIKHHLDSDTFTYHINADSKPLPLRDLEQQIQAYMSDSEDPTISLHLDESVTWKQTIVVMNIAKRNQYKIVLATAPE